MLVFGCAITDRGVYHRCALPGFERAAEPDSKIIGRLNTGSLSEGYNAILDEAARLESLEALVLAHQDLEITGNSFPETVRQALADPDVAIVGAAGSQEVASLSWWNPGPVVGAYEWIYSEDGGGRLEMDDWENFMLGSGPQAVAAVDGMILVLSPWAVHNLRFDTELDPGAHGYDIDICFQAREAGKQVMVADLGVAHHHELLVVPDATDWMEAHVRFSEKWEGRVPWMRSDTDWKERARRAEAAAGAAEIARNELSMLRNEAERRAVVAWERSRKLESELHRIVVSRSWRLLAPLRAVRRALLRMVGRRGERRTGNERRSP